MDDRETAADVIRLVSSSSGVNVADEHHRIGDFVVSLRFSWPDADALFTDDVHDLVVSESVGKAEMALSE